MKKPLNGIELYARLKALSKPMQAFKEHNSASLTVEEVELMREVYDDVNVLSRGQLAQRLNIGCDNCIREAFQVFISVFDRMDKNPQLNPEAVVEGATVSKLDGEDYGDQLPNPATGNGLKGEANLAANNPNQLDLEEQANQLNAAFTARRNSLETLGFTFNEELNVFQREGETDLSADTVRQATEEDFSEGLAEMTKALEPIVIEKPEETPIATGVADNGNLQVPPPVFDPAKEPKKEELTPGLALNTEATKTPAQKKGEEKAATKPKAKAPLKGEANKTAKEPKK